MEEEIENTNQNNETSLDQEAKTASGSTTGQGT